MAFHMWSNIIFHFTLAGIYWSLTLKQIMSTSGIFLVCRILFAIVMSINDQFLTTCIAPNWHPAITQTHEWPGYLSVPSLPSTNSPMAMDMCKLTHTYVHTHKHTHPAWQPSEKAVAEVGQAGPLDSRMHTYIHTHACILGRRYSHTFVHRLPQGHHWVLTKHRLPAWISFAQPKPRCTDSEAEPLLSQEKDALCPILLSVSRPRPAWASEEHWSQRWEEKSIGCAVNSLICQPNVQDMCSLGPGTTLTDPKFLQPLSLQLSIMYWWHSVTSPCILLLFLNYPSITLKTRKSIN